MPMQKVIDKVSEWKGRLIAYGGGSGVSAYSAKSVAQPEKIPETAHQVTDILSVYILPGVTFGSAITILGAAVVVGRFIFDVWKYFDQRKRHQPSEAA
ncbi:TPA: hypothetical protein NJ656_004452 [Vibrio parahaemolyticus]|uniref:hypothetical protein n=1 Tax=Vibrio sp. Isolate23 TaxID=2908533 RepID=UPI001A19D742|nr:hypothetical protein [Vibrio sp. Isolate23]HAS6087818.1 hypothetical protein [Vibrio vulnificus]HCE2656894.1 hypothetical protein [Vibrio parahaemolyticus]MCG9685149.1 hypothetical protein [Vibrio sp. Isolate23]HCE2923509.1 hypothetical protein [Vibrio parahaemolyticus]HCG9453612.1 hypothetical protein [Vibrio parahaemolyticus]